MRCPTLAELPPPPPDKTGWPWTEECPQLPELRPNGISWPRISIVTPSYNQGQYIEETIRSILLQGYPDLEYIIMDGGSRDASVEIIQKYSPWLDHWESVADKGQSNAINKGLSLASGTWFQNINSDDIMRKNTLEKIGTINEQHDAWCGSVNEISESGNFLVPNIGLDCELFLKSLYPNNAHSWHQPGVFLKTAGLRAIGGYPENLDYAFDFVTACIYFEKYTNYKIDEHCAVDFRLHQNSKTTTLRDLYLKESVIAREILSKQLAGSKMRSIAKTEAERYRLYSGLQKITFRKFEFTGLIESIKAIISRPSLIFDPHIAIKTKRFIKRLHSFASP